MGIFDFSLIERGGPLMWPLLVLSLIGFIFFVERTLYLHKGQIRTNTFVDGIKNLVRKRRLLEALTVCEETPGPVASVVKAALLNHDKSEEKMRGAIRDAALVEIPSLERRVGTIAAIAKISPLLGLLGTIVALLNAFLTMQEKGPYANASNFSGDVAQALITTATGLAIAIMAYLAHHFLHGRVRALVHDMEWVGNDIIQFLHRDVPEEESDTEKENG
ncbi:MotA/TolQ/ExbB proton channel family protein [Ruficoccus amylovorans]|uniref:MotA/TolQ/ExbB proton channel family protein n=1 Tax=Ruficoccus amylovorans TaxID=1804625 RepID=A0A842H914_9BACT|nr:MotA/TolQ/ExbB proton channel family protein [Ruficoccus amylovorans]MBC2593013.1 MotA/TolQ/ExbB proton channel family protein [Ruficoccus amylovorans]